MILEDRLAKALNDINAITTTSWQSVISVIDLTLLDEHATAEQLHELASKAQQYSVAALCILPKHLSDISSEISVKRATVANFPSGAQPHQQVLKDINDIATRLRVDEIDYVFNYQAYLAGEQHLALSYCKEAYQVCKEHNLIFKVILETGALPSNASIYEISRAILDHGCNFLKTSTGKIATGATIPAAFSILAAIVDSGVDCGIKVSGGIKIAEQALHFMQLARNMFNQELNSKCFRIGASSLLDEVVKNLQAS